MIINYISIGIFGTTAFILGIVLSGLFILSRKKRETLAEYGAALVTLGFFELILSGVLYLFKISLDVNLLR